MKIENLITDEAIKIVFNNTNFGSRTPRELIAKDLDQVNRGQHVGYTMQCCLLELGLIVRASHRKYVVTEIGKKYLEIIQNTISPIEKKSIMTFSFLETKSFLRDCMERFDNYHQKAFDNNDKKLSDFFWDSYKEICDIYINLSSNDYLTDQIRNNIRSSVKETEKMAIVLLDNVK